MDKIYVIMCTTKLEQDPKTKFPDFGSERIMGWYEDKDTAFERVRENACDINETCYNYAIVEEVKQGLYPCSMNRWFFEYKKDKDEYVQIEQPSFLLGFCGLVV